MGDALQQAADRLSEAADDINGIDADQKVASFLNSLAAALVDLGQAVSAAKDAFQASLDESAQQAEAPQADASGGEAAPQA